MKNRIRSNSYDILELIYEEPINDKIEFLLKHHIALWDVIKSCEINNSSDSSIKSVEVNDIQGLINKTQITKIFINGKKITRIKKNNTCNYEDVCK